MPGATDSKIRSLIRHLSGPNWVPHFDLVPIACRYDTVATKGARETGRKGINARGPECVRRRGGKTFFTWQRFCDATASGRYKTALRPVGAIVTTRDGAIDAVANLIREEGELEGEQCVATSSAALGSNSSSERGRFHRRPHLQNLAPFSPRKGPELSLRMSISP